MYNLEELKYLKLLSKKFPTVQSVCTEIINLEAIMNLPKGTEHFLSDLHGEYESFLHIIKNVSGIIKTKIDEIFNMISEEERKQLATLVYYPEEKLKLIKEEMKSEEELKEYYYLTLYKLVKLCQIVSSKYSRSKVRKSIPKEYEYIIDELLNPRVIDGDRDFYYIQIIKNIIELDRAEAFITVISKLIQQFSIEHLHIIGDIYDRGPGPHIIMDELMKYHSIDIEWGNHDIIWMGAAAGSPACIFNVIRICARYNNLDILEEAYGINLRQFTEFALNEYQSNDFLEFMPKNIDENISEFEIDVLAKTQKAAAIIQFKLEGQLIKRHPEFQMEDRLLLEKIDLSKGTVKIDGKEFKMNDTYFPTLNQNNPYELTQKEAELVNKLIHSFRNSEKLQRHIEFLYTKGSLYKIYNGNLLIHGCVPLDANGKFVVVTTKEGEKLSGRDYLDYIEKIVRKAYYSQVGSEEKIFAEDYMWYLWCGKNSPIFCKDVMRTFERYFVEDKSVRKEHKNSFYEYANEEAKCDEIFEEFNLDKKNAHIICGHMPVKLKDGESPIKANGKFMIIDGGLSKAYQGVTGIAGYTLIYNSYGLMLATHQPFSSTEEAIRNNSDLYSTKIVVEKVDRKLVRDTDIGKELEEQIADLKKLLSAYKVGLI